MISPEPASNSNATRAFVTNSADVAGRIAKTQANIAKNSKNARRKRKDDPAQKQSNMGQHLDSLTKFQAELKAFFETKK
ncbi:MAG: hypothetical protein ACR2OR_06535 [Hyphomicrobiales bacterium]